MNGYVVWLTGDRRRMDGLAEALRAALQGTARSVDVLTAEVVDEKLCSNEPHGADHGAVVVRRLAWLAHVLARNGCAAVAVSASPRRALRDEARGMAGSFVELLVHGEMPEGWEAPHYPEVEALAGDEPRAVAEKVVRALVAAGVVAETTEVYSAEDEKRIKDRLEKLGYL
jgi:hypothetical protein